MSSYGSSGDPSSETDRSTPAPLVNGQAPQWADRAASAPPSPRRWLILTVVLVASVMNQLDSTVTIIAAPSVRASIGGGQPMMQWLSAGYTLSYAVLLVTGGRLGDIYGRRRMFLLGAAGFTAASVLCGFSFDPGLLIGARVVQGVFGALLIPQGLGIIKTVFPPRELGTALGAFAPAMGLASVGGPTFAGALIGADMFGLGWRIVFLINLPIGLFVLLAAVLVLPRKEILQTMRLDIIGVTLVTLASVLLIYPLVQGRSEGWPVWTWAAIALGLVLFALFALYERTTGRAPIIEPSLLHNRTYVSGLAVAIMFFAATSGQSLVLSVYGQLELHFSPLVAALSGIPFSVGITAAGLLANKLTVRFGRRVLHGGLALMVVGLGLLAWTFGHFGTTATVGNLIPPTAVIGTAMGLVFGPLFRTILAGVSQQEVGSASGALNAVQQFGGTIGVASLTTLYFALTADPTHTARGAVITTLVIGVTVAVAFMLVFLLPARPPAYGSAHSSTSSGP